MGTIEKFEDIEAWQKARELTNEVYKITTNNVFSKDFNLKEQIRRASISIMLNISEGFARETDKEFARFLIIAHGSAAEVQSAMYIALDQKYVNENEFNELYKKTEDVSKMLSRFSKYLKNCDLK